MYAYDVNGDKLPDVITSLAAHGYGLAWYEQLPEKSANGEIDFKQHIILNADAKPNEYGISFAQLHAVDLVDMDFDGLKDIVTGKRWWAHGPRGDVEPNAAPVLYWFKITRGSDGVDFVPHFISDASGVGTQVVAGDISGDGRADIYVVTSKLLGNPGDVLLLGDSYSVVFSFN